MPSSPCLGRRLRLGTSVVKAVLVQKGPDSNACYQVGFILACLPWDWTLVVAILAFQQKRLEIVGCEKFFLVMYWKLPGKLSLNFISQVLGEY